MKLVTDVNKDVVTITTETDSDGDVAVKANGVAILWIFRDGVITVNNIPADISSLKGLGFRVNELTNKLKVTL